MFKDCQRKTQCLREIDNLNVEPVTGSSKDESGRPKKVEERIGTVGRNVLTS